MRNQAGKEMIGFCNGAVDKISWVETVACQAGLPITIHLGAELAATRDAIAKLKEAISEWMKGGPNEQSIVSHDKS